MTPTYHDVEQRSEAWRKLRVGVPTASGFSRLVTSAGAPSKSLAGYAGELAAELFAGKPMEGFEGNVWSERGADMEAEAIGVYAFTRDAAVAKCGFVTNHGAGYSPDGLVGEDGLIEVKCLKAERHMKAVAYHEKHGKPPTDYFAQTQGGLWVTGRKWIDTIFYHPDVPLLVIRQSPDAAFHAALAGAVRLVCTERDGILAKMRREQQEIPDSPNYLAAG